VSTRSEFDLTDPETFVRGRHQAIFTWLREHDPSHWHEGGDGTAFWALTRYEDVSWAYQNHAIFSSSHGAILGGSYRDEADTAGGRMLVASDLPRHRLLKRQIHPALSATVASRVGDQVRELVPKALARMRADGGGDFATDIALELPAGALMVIMGIGHAEAHELIGLTRRMIGYRDEVFVDTGGDARLRLAWLQADIFEFFADVVAERRKRPAEDLVSILLRGEINGRRLTEEEVFYNCMNVAVGGNETSSYSACSGLLALMENPGQYETLRRSPKLLNSAIDEMLRWSSTNAYVQRVATCSVERNGVRIREGDAVALWNVSANFDGNQFPDPDRFDVARSPNRHLTYGVGIHRCIGAPVAQLELSVLFQEVLAADSPFRLAGEVRRLRSNFILGITHLPVEIG
jgi:cytochrome P450